MKDEEIKKIILNYIKEEFGIQKNRNKHYSYCSAPFEDCTCNDLLDATYKTSLMIGGYIDSFSMLGVVVWMEDMFNIQIPDKCVIPENIDNVDKMMDLINRYK